MTGRLAAVLLLTLIFLCGCGAEVSDVKTETPEVSQSAAQTEAAESGEFGESGGLQEGRLSMKARFRMEDGSPLRQGTVRLTGADGSTDYALSSDGVLESASLPCTGELCLILLDGQQREIRTMPLQLSQGSVIDANTDDGGTGHVMTRADTDKVTLDFTLTDEGKLVCTLHLSEN